MSRPGDYVQDVRYLSQFLHPVPTLPLEHTAWGGEDINDSSQGLLARQWTARLDEDGWVRVYSPGKAPYSLLEAPGTQYLTLAFDQNGQPVLGLYGPLTGIYWYDTSAPASWKFTALPAAYPRVLVFLDDYRPTMLTANISTVRCLYWHADHTVRQRNLYDRFTADNVLASCTPQSGLSEMRAAGMCRDLRVRARFIAAGPYTPIKTEDA